MFAESIIGFWEATIIVCFLIYNSINFVIFSVALIRIKFFLRIKNTVSVEEICSSLLTPSVALLIPAFNEEQTISNTILALTKLKYPKLEIIIINDGSSDRTLDVLINRFGFRKCEVVREDSLETATLLSCYETFERPEHVIRFILVDKENGGKADALNAGINFVQSRYFCSIDADSIVDQEQALLQVMRPMISNPDEVFASGAQVGIANGCEISHGDVVKVSIPTNWLAKFQVAEYMRSFTTGRMGLSTFKSLLILSGVFAVFRKDIVVRVGGFLSGRSRLKIVREYCQSQKTVCEDMEIIVRIYRYLFEHGLKGRIEFLPYPVVWSQCPERISDYIKQRNRWYRGLGESLYYHREMIFNYRYKQIGMFALPYQLLFEFIGPILETVGYITIPILHSLNLLRKDTFVLFLVVSILHGSLLSVYSVMVGLWSERKIGDAQQLVSLFQYRGINNRLQLILLAMISTLSYRYLQLFAQMKGLFDFSRGSQAWEKFERDEI